MAQVRNFRDYVEDPELEEEETPDAGEPSYKEKIRSHRVMVFYRGILMAAATVAIITAIYINWRGRSYTEMRVVRTSPLSGMEGSTVLALGKNAIRYSKDGMSCIAPDGSVLWDVTYEMQSPIVRTCGETAAVGDNGGNTIYVAGKEGSMGQISTNLPINDFTVSAKGVVAATLSDGEISRVRLYDSKGNELAAIKATMPNSGYPLSVSISPDGELVGCAYLGVNGDDVESRMTFYNFGDVGQNETDNMVSSFKYPGNVIPFNVFINEDTNMAVTDDRVLFFKGSDVPNNPVTELTGEKEILSIYYSSEYAGIIGTGRSLEGKYELSVYNTKGSKILEMPFDINYTGMFFSDDQFVIYNDRDWILYGLDGSKKYEGSFDKPIQALLPGRSRSRFTMISANSIEEIELR